MKTKKKKQKKIFCFNLFSFYVQSTYRSLARIFLPSIFQSYYNSPTMSSKIFWKKWKKEKADVVQQENERLLLEQCLISMIVHVDLLCRVGNWFSFLFFIFEWILQIPNNLTIELNLPTPKTSKRLNELVTDECNGEFDLKKYTAKKTEEFLQVPRNRKRTDFECWAFVFVLVNSGYQIRNSKQFKRISMIFICRCTNQLNKLYRFGNVRSIFRM